MTIGLDILGVAQAVGEQLRNNIDKQINVDVDGAGMAAPVIRLELQASDPVDYWTTMSPDGAEEFGGVTQVRFDVIIDPAGVDQSAVRRLYGMLSVGTNQPDSVIDALFADKTLGGAVETLRLSGTSEYDAINVTATLPLEVVCRKQGANS